jgi:PhnB protein
MTKQVRPIPEGYHSITPYLAIKDAARAIEFYQRAFGAKEIMRMNTPQGKVSHAEIKIGDSILMLSEESLMSGIRPPQGLEGSPVSLFLYVEDVDSVFKNALSAGAKEQQPLATQFWGDRYGRLTDPFGHSWSLATHVEDVAPEEMGKRAQEAAKAAQRAHAGG